MSKHFSGSFYFEKTVNGNLIGEFSNNSDDTIMTESANKVNPDGKFEGTYISTWFDIDLTKADLEIKPNGHKYILTWTGTGGQEYKGEGFLAGDRLIGYYKKSN